MNPVNVKDEQQDSSLSRARCCDTLARDAEEAGCDIGLLAF